MAAEAMRVGAGAARRESSRAAAGERLELGVWHGAARERLEATRGGLMSPSGAGVCRWCWGLLAGGARGQERLVQGEGVSGKAGF